MLQVLIEPTKGKNPQEIDNLNWKESQWRRFQLKN